MVAYLALRALRPNAKLPGPLRWFGEPTNWPTIAIVVAVLGLVCLLSYRLRRRRDSATVPVAIVIGLTATSVVLGFSSFWSCDADKKHTPFFAALVATASLVKGGVDDRSCPEVPPAALDVARLSILAAIFVSVAGVATTLFRSQSDRLRARFARSITAVVGIDDDAQTMVSAVAGTLDSSDTLVLVTGRPDRPCVQECRNRGARVVPVDFSRSDAFKSLRWWRRLERLYLLSPDASTNLSRLEGITRALEAVSTKRRLPLIVRFDDPWQAEAFRAERYGEHGSSDTQWAADAVGKYEVTAGRLLDALVELPNITRLLVCGSSPLTLALCADLARRQTERDFHTAAGEPDLPALTLVAESAEEYRQDHELHQRRRGLTSSRPPIDVVAEAPSVPVLAALIEVDENDAAATAVIFVDLSPTPGSGVDTTTGTRLASRFPAITIYVWDPGARASDDRPPVVGQLRTYRLAMDLPDGQAQDNWERAAMLTHERYASGTKRDTPATLPWAQLDDFYKESNRRQLRNVLWMVEDKAGHTWNTWGNPPDELSLSSLAGLEARQQLRLLGFSLEAARAMAQEEFEDWSRYYRKAGWNYGPVRNDEHKIHNKLVSWATTEQDPELRAAAYGSLAATVLQLRELGYRSRPVAGPSDEGWAPYRRTGTVTALQRSAAWTWKSHSGQTMHAAAGDWEVRDGDADSWSVRDDIFRSTYQHVDGDRWRRGGFVVARPARGGETVDTLEGPVTAADGDWVVQGEEGEQWPVPGEEFARRYQSRARS